MAFGDLVQQVATTGASGSATSPTISAATAGNLLVLSLARSGAQTTYPSVTGFTALHAVPAEGGPALAGKWWWKISAGGETGVTLADEVGAGNWRMSLAEFEGPFEASPFDVEAEDESNIAATDTVQPSGTTATTAQADALALALFVSDSAGSFDTGRSYDNSFTEQFFESATVSAARAGMAMASRVLTATGTYTTSMTTTDTGDEMWGAIAVWKKSGGGGGGGSTYPGYYSAGGWF